jgi:hypothetical protein
VETQKNDPKGSSEDAFEDEYGNRVDENGRWLFSPEAPGWGLPR